MPHVFSKNYPYPKNPWTLQWKGLNLYSRGQGPQNSFFEGSGFLGYCGPYFLKDSHRHQVHKRHEIFWRSFNKNFSNHPFSPKKKRKTSSTKVGYLSNSSHKQTKKKTLHTLKLTAKAPKNGGNSKFGISEIPGGIPFFQVSPACNHLHHHEGVSRQKAIRQQCESLL